jgi:hypothetical protein
MPVICKFSFAIFRMASPSRVERFNVLYRQTKICRNFGLRFTTRNPLANRGGLLGRKFDAARM